MSEQISSLALRNFVQTCRSPATRSVYVKAIGYFMDYLKIDKRKYDKLLPPERDTKTIQMDICDFITYLRDTGRSSASVSTYVTALHKFYSMNDITTLNWEKIHSFEREGKTHRG